MIPIVHVNDEELSEDEVKLLQAALIVTYDDTCNTIITCPNPTFYAERLAELEELKITLNTLEKKFRNE